MTLRRAPLLVLLILVLALLPSISVLAAPAAPGIVDPRERETPDVTPPNGNDNEPQDNGHIPAALVFRVAEPRAGIVSPERGDADNLMASLPSSATDPLTTVSAGMRIALRSAYEAVFFANAGGTAIFEIEVYRVLGSGERVLLATDQHVHAGIGPRRVPGALNVRVPLTEPGLWTLAIVSRSTADPTDGDPVVDEDEIIVHVLVAGTPTPAFTPTPTPPLEATPEDVELAPAGATFRRSSAGRALAASAALGSQDTSAAPRPTPDPSDLPVPQPWPIERTITVAHPRGHLLSGGAGGAENSDQNHGRVIYVLEGHTLTFQSEYEFVWFDGAGGMAHTDLELRADGLVESPLVENGTDKSGNGATRIAGTLDAALPFPNPGEYDVEARIYTSVSPSGEALSAVIDDEDVVRMRVVVVDQPDVGAIAGMVTAEEDDVPLQRVAMRAVDANTGRIVRTTYTGADGRYLLASLPPGKYVVQADPLLLNYLGEWWDDKPTRDQADPIEVVAEQTVEDIDFGLTEGGVISGQVIEDDPDSVLPVIRPLGGVLVVAGRVDDDVIVQKTRTLRDGTYRLEKLPAGLYWVHAGNAAWTNAEEVDYAPLIGEYWDDHLEREDADPVDVATGQQVERINFALRYGGTISGRVTGNSTTPVVVPFKVTAYDWNTNAAVKTVLVGPGGLYRISPLPEGRYRVYAFDEQGYFIPKYYDDVTDPTQATPVDVRRGQVAKGIDFVLDAVGSATLHILPRVTQAFPDDVFTVTVEVADVVDLGSFSFAMTWDARILDAEACALGAFLGSTGRQTLPLGPTIDNESGTLEFAASSFGDEAGPTGDGVLAVVTFRAQSVGDTLLALQNTQLVDTQAQPLEHLTHEARVLVGDCIFGDFDCDCDVDIVDIMQVASRWGAVIGDPEYDPTFDLDDDGDIDIVDIALVAAAWGSTCDGTVQGSQSLSGSRARMAGSPSLRATGMSIAPTTQTAEIGAPVSIDLRIADAQDLGGFQVTVVFDADKLALSASDVALGDVLGSTGRAATLMPPQISVNGSVGTASLGAFALGAGIPGPSGDGVLATLTFTALSSGDASLDLKDAQVTDTTGEGEESVALSGGSVTVEGAQLAAAGFLPHVTR